MTSSNSDEFGWIQVETGERYTDDILLRIHDVLIEKPRRAFFLLQLLSVAVTELKIQSWKVRTSFFYPYYWLSVFWLFLAKRIRRKFLSIDHENEIRWSGIFRSRWKLIWSTLLSANELTSCRSLIYWSFKPPKLNLFNNSCLTRRK